MEITNGWDKCDCCERIVLDNTLKWYGARSYCFECLVECESEEREHREEQRKIQEKQL